MTNFELSKELFMLTAKPEIKSRIADGRIQLRDVGGDAVLVVNMQNGKQRSSTLFSCTDWSKIMPIAIELGVSLTSIGDCEYSAHDGIFHHSGSIFDMSNEFFDDGPIISLTKCCIAVLNSKKEK